MKKNLLLLDPRGWHFRDELPTSETIFYAYLKFARDTFLADIEEYEELNPFWHIPLANDSLETLSYHYRYLNRARPLTRLSTPAPTAEESPSPTYPAQTTQAVHPSFPRGLLGRSSRRDKISIASQNRAAH